MRPRSLLPLMLLVPAIYAPAQVPSYQREFRGSKYPAPERQQEVHQEHYRYQPREQVVRDHYEKQAEHSRTAPGREEEHKRH